MKINPSWQSENSEAKEKNKPNWQSERRRRAVTGEGDAAIKYRLTEPAIKEETKFVNILDAAAKPQKPNQTGKDSSEEQRRDDEKKEQKRALGEADASDVVTDHQRIERRGSSYNGQFGGSSGFGGGAEAGHSVTLSENFAARSILHIADLERMISIIRTQTAPGEKREVYLELKRSVLDGLRVKISTDPAAQVQIEFLAANEKIRSQIESHSEELAGILRERGVKLLSLRTSIDSYEKKENDADAEITAEGNTFQT